MGYHFKTVHKASLLNPKGLDLMTGDLVVVDADPGFDVGRISLSGELVRLPNETQKGF